MSGKRRSKKNGKHVEMVNIHGGTFTMGSNSHYQEEAPERKVTVTDFFFDKFAVTANDFKAFVDDTDYKTVAERPLDPKAYPGALPELLVPGALVFKKAKGPVNLRDYRNWWEYVPGANWKNPDGPKSGIKDRMDHPVTQVAYDDALAFTKWANKELPTEAQFEFAARGGLDEKAYVWGDTYNPEKKALANTWEGEFPWENHKHDGYVGTSPVGSYSPNGYGLYDMAGNVWEWTSDWYTQNSKGKPKKHCCVPLNPRITNKSESYDPHQPQVKIPRKVLKGGSHLCAKNFCLRYRPAARSPEMIDTATTHIGFRCVTNIAN